MSRQSIHVALLSVLLLSACVSSGGHVVADRLFLGLSVPGGGNVSNGEWDTFVRDFVTPRFPGGFTVWRAEGQWRGVSGEVVSEPVIVLEIVHPESAESDASLGVIIAEYKRRFRQEAVLHVRAPARMTLR